MPSISHQLAASSLLEGAWEAKGEGSSSPLGNLSFLSVGV